MAAGPVVHCQGLTKRFDDVPAVDDVGFSLEPGEVLSILGPSGSGKTTLLRLIAGFEPLDGGEIFIQGRRVSGRSVHLQPESRRVGMVFQDYALFPHMTVEQNVSFWPSRPVERGPQATHRRGCGARRTTRPGGALSLSAIRWPAAEGRPRPNVGAPACGPPAGRAVQQYRLDHAVGDAQGGGGDPRRERRSHRVRDSRPGRGFRHRR